MMSKQSIIGTVQKKFIYIVVLCSIMLLIISSYVCNNAAKRTVANTEKNILLKMQLSENMLMGLIEDINDMTSGIEKNKDLFLSSDTETISKANMCLNQSMDVKIVGASVLQLPDGRVYKYNPDGIFLDILQLNLFCGSYVYGVPGLKWYIDDDPDRVSPYLGYYVVCTDIPLDDASYIRIFYFVKKNVLIEILSNVSDDNNVAIIMDNGSRFLINDVDAAEKIMLDNSEILFELSDFNASSYKFHEFNDKYLMTYYKSPKSNFSLLSVVEKKAVYHDMYYLLWFFLLLFLTFTVIAVFIYRSLCKTCIAPFNRLLQSLQEGKLNSSEIKGCEKIELLSQCCDKIYSENIKLKEIREKQKKAMQKMEIAAMHKRLTPHFFYNTLSNIRFMAVMRGQEEIGTVIARFAEMNKYLFSQENELITIREELEFIKNYVSLMNIRYFNNINAFYLIDEEMYEKKIPMFSLQPIVENSIVHGIAKKLNDKEKAFLRITISGENGKMLISICDNGSGVPEDTLNKIRLMPQNGRQNMGIGVYGTLSKFKYYYGEKFTFDVKSKKGESTEFVFKIPLEQDIIEE